MRDESWPRRPCAPRGDISDDGGADPSWILIQGYPSGYPLEATTELKPNPAAIFDSFNSGRGRQSKMARPRVPITAARDVHQVPHTLWWVGAPYCRCFSLLSG